MKCTRMVVRDSWSHRQLPSRFLNGCLGLALALFSGLGFQAYAAVDWPVLGSTQVVTHLLSNPTCITHAGDGSQRWFVAERSGRITIIQNGGVLAQPFLDITDRMGRPQ